MKKWMKVSVITVVSSLAIVGIGYAANSYLSKENAKIVAAEKNEPIPVKQEVLQSLSNTEQKKTDLSNYQVKTKESAVIDRMHKMTHQKVAAAEKWGTIFMDPIKVKKLKTIVEHSNYNNKNELLAILNRWYEGDFSKAVEDHNFLWSIEGGEKGKAYRLLTAEEEQEYIKQVKKDDTQEYWGEGEDPLLTQEKPQN
ncbi:DUF6241 domain-containing protein [Bacillus pacificus]|uniref:DUF6241 domain-containing protein n=1 Tax=Bacillus cereus group TaxID=86661 RepID=UPI0024BD4F7D|nr:MULTISPECIES: DUF6241 domain-containing protein [Bacillus cereus group]MCU5722259.1 DUF6241 domain-containing protein [Bacillus cereus]HDR8409187.1 PRK06770 family protein [Bacillus cereus]